MTIPDYQTFMRPVLEALADGGEHTSRQLVSEAADALGVPEDERHALLESGRQTVLRSRVGWAVQYLAQAGALTRARRGVFRSNERGQALLASSPGRITRDDLMQFEEFRDFVDRGRRTQRAGDAGGGSGVQVGTGDRSGSDQDLTPGERVVAAAREANAEVASELLQRVNEQDPDFLERVVLDLLVAMGYAGARGSIRHLGRSGDEGVDGVLRQDTLGLDLIYVQAKRYASGRTVGRPELQAFAGALQGAQASRGVFITTSQFSRDAVDFAERVPQRIILIDGPELARLMVEHGVGVQTDQVITLVKLDEDFFE